MNLQWERKRLTDIATVERAKPDKVYPSGTICVPLSAYSRGAIYQLEASGPVENRYACIIPNDLDESDYMYSIVQLAIEEFEAKFVTGINLQMPIFEKYFTVQWHEDPDTRRMLQEALGNLIEQERLVQRQLELANEVKAYYLDKMFV